MAKQTNLEEIFVAPLEDIVGKIASAVARAQVSLDTNFLNSQKDLKKNYPDLADIGYVAPWYYMPETNVELKMVMHYEESGKKGSGSKYLPYWSPYNAKYASDFTFDAGGTSSIKFKIVSIPPPISVTAKPTKE